MNPGPKIGFQFRLAGSSNRLWKPGQTLQIRFFGGSQQLQQRVANAANEWTQHANIMFNFVQSEPSDNRIAFRGGDGSWSAVGTDAKQRPATDPTMNFGWFDDSTDGAEIQRTTLHEFGHALGMIHEHQSP